jgi:thioredoxin-like negative regulator of GroEL
MQITFIIIGVFFLFLAFLVYRTKRQMKRLKDVKDSEKVKILTDQNFSVKTKTGTVLVDFWASWCMPMQADGPGSE